MSTDAKHVVSAELCVAARDDFIVAQRTQRELKLFKSSGISSSMCIWSPGNKQKKKRLLSALMLLLILV